MCPARIVIAEDDIDLAEGLRFYLETEGYEVTVAPDGAAAVDLLAETEPDLLLLDLVMPKLSGYQVLERLRTGCSPPPVVVLSARGDETAKVRCLDLGASDFLVKPAGLAELAARIRVRLREGRRGSNVVTIGRARVDLAAREVRRGDTRLPLTVREADMLRLLVAERGRVVTRPRFLADVWHHKLPPGDTRTVDQFVRRLRTKIEDEPTRPRYLLTIVGVGYRLQVEPT